MRAVVVSSFGGPEALEPAEVPSPDVPEGQLEITVSGAGVNYADLHQTEDSYVVPARVPFIPGTEVVGTVDGGRRVVAFVDGGGYAEIAVATPALAWDVPDDVSDDQALAVLLQGVTAWHLLRTSAQLRAGECVVVHAAGGGVGTLAIQLAKRFGAGRVVGVASTDEKRSLALRLGADAVVDSSAEDLTAALREANGGRRVDVVLEMAGGPTFAQSLDALAPFGRLVHYGSAGRAGVPSVDPSALLRTGRGVLGFWLALMMRTPERVGEALADLLAAVQSGELETVLGGTYPLDEARRAHEDMLARRSAGKLVLLP